MARVRVWYAVGSVALGLGYYTLPALRPATAALIGLLAVGAIEYGVRRSRPQRQGAWRVLEFALLLLATGDVIFLVLEAGRPSPVPFPSWPEVFYLAAYVPLTIGLLWLGRPTVPYRDETKMIDVASITLAGSLVAWITIVDGAIDRLESNPLARFTAVAAWVGYVAVFAASVQFVLAWRRNPAVRLLGLAAASFLVAEIFYGHKLLVGSFTAGGWVDAGYIAFGVLCGASALLPSMVDVASPAHARHRLGPGRLALIAIGMLVAPTVLLAEASMGAVTAGVAIAIVSALVSILMLLRLAMTARAYQRRAAREQAARQASRNMVRATTPADVVAGTSEALAAVLPARAPPLVRLVGPEVRGPASAPPTVVIGSQEGVGAVTIPLAGLDAALSFTGPIRELTELMELLEALADQAALALNRIRLMERERVEERDRYFRTLVDTSSDVILITRDGRIEYATPSARAMFGREVVGERFDDLVQPVGEPGQTWSDTVDGGEGHVARPAGDATVVVHRRDLSSDPAVQGVVTTMRDVTAERALQQDLAYRATHDELTGLANGRMWGRALADEEERRVRQGTGTAVLFIDVDEFKNINDTYGHAAGDSVLAEVGRRIDASVRDEDLVARVGGDEFAVLLRSLASADDARAVASRIAEALGAPAYVYGEPVDCRASIGLAYTERREQVRGLTGKADIALYAAKAGGKGTWSEYEPGMPGRRRLAQDRR